MTIEIRVVEVVQIVGALMLLLCYLLAQAKRMSPEGYPYLLLNLVGSLVMTITALIAYQWGFVFMEGVWALFSAWGLMQRLRAGAAKEIH